MSIKSAHPLWLSLQEVADYFGMSVQTVRNNVYQETFFLPSRKEGTRRVVYRSVLDAYLAEATASEAEKFEQLRARKKLSDGPRRAARRPACEGGPG